MKVLILEPDKILANNYKTVFINAGLEPVICYDPQLAVEYMDNNMPDAIVLELQLAPHSGVAFIHELRGYEDFANIPVIVYSSVPKDSFKIDTKGWQSLGIIKYFYKSRIPADKVASFIKGYLS